MEVEIIPTVEVRIQLTAGEHEQLANLAEREGVSESSLIQRALAAFLDSASDDGAADHSDWQALGLAAFEAEWNNPEDAIYDNWRDLYRVGVR